ncbi:molecular chaperone DnaK [Flavobacteriales bacterium 33_180_T64]|nr:molecular chaperone DnaK [Flavobacteriales bacterium 33_180_T64]
MKKSKILIGAAVLTIAGFFTIAADHIDAPAVIGGTSDITDLYAFQGQNTNNIVFVANVQGLLSPASTTGAAFDENILIEFNIDNDGDAIEDLVIQATPRDGKMYFFGPFAPAQTGLNSTILSSNGFNTVDITPYGTNAIIETNNDMSFFAGPRDDPFFFDFTRYTEIISGTATSFNNPGNDTFEGTNALSVVVELPKAMVGSGDTVNVWVESKRKQ